MANNKRLGKLFLSARRRPVETGKFMSRLADILSTDEDAKKGSYFDVFVCEKRGRFIDIKGKHFFNQTNILPWLFDHCGSGGWEIIRTEMGAWNYQGGGVNWSYTIYVERKV